MAEDTIDWKAMNDWNKSVIEEFRATGGKPGGQMDGAYVLLLMTIGAKSGQRRTNPLIYLPYNDSFVIFASKGGSPTHPDWYHNLIAHPQATVEVGTETFEVTARVATGELRDQLYAMQAKAAPQFADYGAKTARQIPVIILERRTA
ncbi:MAG TPA: nitroreductase family deazaflavin-dependent oxidoreductase [Ktedonobacteraceae bacterium]|jgi:deazaflavin-dependent oxidoreductase (nitroreductase family)